MGYYATLIRQIVLYLPNTYPATCPNLGKSFSVFEVRGASLRDRHFKFNWKMRQDQEMRIKTNRIARQWQLAHSNSYIHISRNKQIEARLDLIWSVPAGCYSFGQVSDYTWGLYVHTYIWRLSDCVSIVSVN